MPNWNEILAEIGQNNSPKAVDDIRRKYLVKFQKYTDRNIIAYYSGWLSKPGLGGLCTINDEDKNGFMMAIHQLDRKKGLDIILHTPGGQCRQNKNIHIIKISVYSWDISCYPFCIGHIFYRVL